MPIRSASRRAPVLVVLSWMIALGLWLESAGTAAAESLPTIVERAHELEPERVEDMSSQHRSKLHAAFHRYARSAPRAQLVRLLGHKNPVVRAYVIEYLTLFLPAHADAFYPLLKDQTRVPVAGGGCEPLPAFIIATSVIEALCQVSDDHNVGWLLQRAAADPELPSRIRETALACYKAARD